MQGTGGTVTLGGVELQIRSWKVEIVTPPDFEPAPLSQEELAAIQRAIQRWAFETCPRPFIYPPFEPVPEGRRPDWRREGF